MVVKIINLVQPYTDEKIKVQKILNFLCTHNYSQN